MYPWFVFVFVWPNVTSQLESKRNIVLNGLRSSGHPISSPEQRVATGVGYATMYSGDANALMLMCVHMQNYIDRTEMWGTVLGME